MSENKSKSKFNLASLQSVEANKEAIDKVVNAVNSKSTKVKAKAVGDKPKDKAIPCWIYTGRLKTYPMIEMTQVRFADFPSLEDCISVCEEIFTSYTIKSVKKNEILVKK